MTIPESDAGEQIRTLFGAVADGVDRVFAQMGWAESEIRTAMARHPRARDTLFHGFSLLTPTHELMRTEFVYRAHCRELLHRVAAGADAGPGTAAEICCACHDSSTVAPMRSAAAGLYMRMWKQAFPAHAVFADRLPHHEALEAAQIDELESLARRRLAVADRKLTAITCAGFHHGRRVRCRYNGATTRAAA